MAYQQIQVIGGHVVVEPETRADNEKNASALEDNFQREQHSHHSHHADVLHHLQYVFVHTCIQCHGKQPCTTVILTTRSFLPRKFLQIRIQIRTKRKKSCASAESTDLKLSVYASICIKMKIFTLLKHISYNIMHLITLG